MVRTLKISASLLFFLGLMLFSGNMCVSYAEGVRQNTFKVKEAAIYHNDDGVSIKFEFWGSELGFSLNVNDLVFEVENGVVGTRLIANFEDYSSMYGFFRRGVKGWLIVSSEKVKTVWQKEIESAKRVHQKNWEKDVYPLVVK